MRVRALHTARIIENEDVCLDYIVSLTNEEVCGRQLEF